MKILEDSYQKSLEFESLITGLSNEPNAQKAAVGSSKNKSEDGAGPTYHINPSGAAAVSGEVMLAAR